MIRFFHRWAVGVRYVGRWGLGIFVHPDGVNFAPGDLAVDVVLACIRFRALRLGGGRSWGQP